MKNLLIYIKIILFMSILSLSPSVYSKGEMASWIKSQCPTESSNSLQIVNDYAVRMKPSISQYGCAVLYAYKMFSDKDFNRIREWENSKNGFETVAAVFSIDERLELNLANDISLFNLIYSFESSSDPKLKSIFLNLVKSVSSLEKVKIKTSPKRVIYIIWLAQWVHNGSYSTEQTYDLLQQLMQSVPERFLWQDYILSQQIQEIYPEIKHGQVLDLISELHHDYPKDLLNKMFNNSTAFSNIVFLIPPQNEDIPDVQNFNRYELDAIRDRYKDVILHTVNAFQSVTQNIGLSMEGTKALVPYILYALSREYQNSEAIQQYLKAQITSPIFIEYVNNDIQCHNNFVEIVSRFFSFLAPLQKQGNDFVFLIEYQNNLNDIAKLYKTKSFFKDWINDGNENPEQFIKAMSVFPRFYLKQTNRAQEVINDLEVTLPGKKSDISNLMRALHDQKYFEWLENSQDAYIKVDATEDNNYLSARKYRYILITPYPKDDDLSVYKRFQQKHDGVNLIKGLYPLTIESLEQHDFTNKEKVESYVDTAMNTIVIFSTITPVGSLFRGAAISSIFVKFLLKKAITTKSKNNLLATSKTQSGKADNIIQVVDYGDMAYELLKSNPEYEITEEQIQETKCHLELKKGY